MDFCQYVNPFYGNFEPNLPKPNETASKWFFLKAQVGNTTPAAALPFGMVTSCAYTGGYPTGYGPYLPNSYARPSRFLDENKITALGFSHFHQSGTGDIGEFYNFSIITPTGKADHKRFDRYALKNESAKPGVYECTLGDVECKMTVSDKGAAYHFDFTDEGTNKIVFDPILNGLFKNEKTPASPLGTLKSSEIESRTASVTAEFSNGITLHTAVFCADSFECKKESDNRLVFFINGKSADMFVSFSFKSKERALKSLDDIKEKSFEKIKAEAQAKWNTALSKIQIESSEKYKTKFYSNLYHSLIKPICLNEDNGFGIEGSCYCDLATLWDMSKTQLPLVFSVFDGESSQIVNSFLGSFKKFKAFPNSFLLSGSNELCNLQARALTVNSVYDAYLRDVKGVDWNLALDFMIQEINADINADFFKNKPVSDYASHTIDLAIAANSISCLAKELGKADIAEKYSKLSENWVSVYDKKTGVLFENGKYYEGCSLNYSYRLLFDMDKRIEIAGGKEKFEKALDEFFGFNKRAAVQCKRRSDVLTLKRGEARRGFEGFNNETDMETPYNYCFIGRSDKACNIVRSGEKYIYGEDGQGALCGNNDSGAMSSLYVVNSLGIFPCFGQDRIILGSPAMKGATLSLRNGNTLKIATENFDENKFVPKEIFLNGSKLTEPFITVRQLMQGGEIKFIF